MSFESMLAHRIQILRLDVTDIDGAAEYTYTVVKSNVKARIDLSFLRPGRDDIAPPEAGRPTDRSGVLFLMPGTDIITGDRIKVTKGPIGTFEITGSIDPIQGRWGDEHHLEVGVREVAKPLGRT